jgi:hypothetical protein
MADKPAISAEFINYTADILGDTDRGLSTWEILRAFTAYAVEFDVAVPHRTYSLGGPTKRNILYDNLTAFSDQQKYRIILELCEHPSIRSHYPEAAQKLKLTLMARYSHLAAESLGDEVNEELIEQTRHWLGPFPDVLRKFNEALQKYEARVFVRNVLDDLRLSLEMLLRAVLKNDKSLEHQQAFLGAFVKARGGSPELSNMFSKLVEYYCKYQNTYVKHDDAVIEEEVEFVIEITSTFMKHLVRLAGKDAA